MQNSQSNQSNIPTLIGTNSYLLNGYRINYDGNMLKIIGNGQVKNVQVPNNSTQYASYSNNKILNVSPFYDSNSFAKISTNNGKLSIDPISQQCSQQQNNSNSNNSNNNLHNSNHFDLNPMISSINGELEKIKNKLPLSSFMSIEENIKNIISSMSLANFHETKNPEIYSGLKWVIYGVYYGENLSSLTTPMTSSNVSSWPSSVPLTNPVYSGCSYNFLNFVGSTTSTNTSGLNAIADNTGQSYFTVVWYGYFMPNVTGNWTFQTATDDGSYLWVNSDSLTPIANFDSFSTTNPSACGITLSNALISNGNTHGVVNVSATSSFTAGKLYPIIILAGQNGGGYSCAVTVTDPNSKSYSSDCAYIFGNYISN